MTPISALDIHPEVAAALAAGTAVVALESTLIAHGMSWPQNAQTAMQVQAAVRAEGAVPATIAIVGGRLTAGLSNEQINTFARDGANTPKASRRDVPFLIAQGQSGATTVAATMIIAAMAGIKVFATGGIGGVHRGAEASLDISADLQELARTDVAVVCAGAKAILDLPLTLEYLETHGVPVIGFGTDELPAFYSRGSGLRLEHRLDDAASVARVMHAKWGAQLHGGLLITNPIPAEHAMPHERVEAAITQALLDAKAQGVHGKKITPFLLDRVSALTGGDSLQSNIALVLNNARLAARVALAYSSLLTNL